MPSCKKDLNFLVTDDSSTVRKFIVRALQRMSDSYKITEAVDGDACYEQMKTGDFDIAFIDVNMPGKSGFEAVKLSAEQGVRTFTVIMSGESTPSRYDEARSLEAYEFLLKPFSEKDIESVIHNYMRFMDVTSVLLVDDSKAIRKVVKKVLKNSRFNINIDEAIDGPGAILAYQNDRHDVVFLDLNMPGIDGYETLEVLKEMNKDVKVVVVTADQKVTFDEINSKYGIEKLLYKPFYSVDVDRILHHLFDLKLPNLLIEDDEIILHDTKSAQNQFGDAGPA